MAFSPVPKESKTQINKAGKILADRNSDIQKHLWARELTSRWRACHAYPINTFQSTLRTKLRNYSPETIVAQRLKRMPTIIDKLMRYPTMELTAMQDIAGVRAVLPNVTEAKKLVEEYRKSSFSHKLIGRKDYITNPRDEDGYRSIHLIYRYTNRITPDYNGLRLELQIRSRLQHTWATAVETMGTLLGQALKSRQGDQEWIDFFAITSSAFAYIENQPIIPRFKNLSKDETFHKVVVAEKKLKAMEMMSGITIAVQDTTTRQRKYYYHLLVLDSLQNSITIKAYNRDSINQAIDDYSEYEQRAAGGESIEPVLVSAGKIDQLKRAYPNFFLDIREFQKRVQNIITNKSG